MFKYIVLLALVACAMAEPKPGYLAPAVAVAHSVPVATSYANTYQVSVKSPVIASAPIYAHAAPYAYAAHAAPYAYAAHAYGVHAAPLAYAAPVASWVR